MNFAASLVWGAFFIFSVASLTSFLIVFPKYHRICISLMVFLTCHIKKPFYYELLFRVYRGVDRGFGVTFPDIFFFSFAFYLLIKRPWKLKWTHPGLTLWWLIIGASFLSLANAGDAFAGLFTIHKFLRASLLFWVIINIIKTKEDIIAVMNGCVAALAFQGLTTLWAKYVSKTVVNRVRGSFNHPNAFAMYVDMLLPVVWACYMEKIFSKKMARWALVGIGTCFICVIFTKSRAATVLLPLTLGGTTGLSMMLKPNLHKTGITILALIGGIIVMSLAMPTIVRRFQKAPKESAETRDYFNIAAAAMAHDQFFGCGINNYAWALKNSDYYWYMYPEALELPDPEAFRESDHGSSRLGTAHNIYYLFLGETGVLGCTFLALMFAAFYLQILINLFRVKDPVSRAVMCGLAASFPLLYLHSKLEWVWRQTQSLYLYFILAGMIVAVRNYSQTTQRRRKNRKAN